MGRGLESEAGRAKAMRSAKEERDCRLDMLSSEHQGGIL
jgi:hypothetical protein